MRRQVFATAVSIALLFGAAAPALAAPGKGKAKGHVNKPVKTKPAPKVNNKSGVSGGGEVAGGSFSAQARLKHQPKGHFNYTSTDGTFKLRCRGFEHFTAVKAGTTVNFTNCQTTTGAEPNQVRTTVGTVGVSFVDNGQPSEAPGALKDRATFTIAAIDYGGDLTGGNIKIR